MPELRPALSDYSGGGTRSVTSPSPVAQPEVAVNEPAPEGLLDPQGASSPAGSADIGVVLKPEPEHSAESDPVVGTGDFSILMRAADQRVEGGQGGFPIVAHAEDEMATRPGALEHV